MAALPWDLLGRLLSLVDKKTLISLSQTCREVEGMARQLVQTVRLVEDSMRRALLSDRFGPAFAACRTLEVTLRDDDAARELCALLRCMERKWQWTQLRTLQLRCVDLDEGEEDATPLDLLPQMAVMPPTISRLDISFDVEADEIMLRVLGSMTQLTSLHLQLEGGPHDLGPLGGLAQLQQLHLRAWVDDDSEAWLPSSLQALTLCSNEEEKCGPSWTHALRACTQLRNLTLQGMGQDDNPVVDLASCAQLTKLDGWMANCSLGIFSLPPAIKILQLGARINDTREGLCMGEPACYLEQGLPAGLMACTDLEVLQVQCYDGPFPLLPKLHTACLRCGPDDDFVEDVAPAWTPLPSSIRSLELCPVDILISLQHITSCTDLRELCLNASDGDFSLNFQHLRPLTALTKLALCGRKIAAFDMVHEEELLQLPLRQLYVLPQLLTRLQNLVGAQCEVLA